MDGQQVLARLAEVPITAWNYKAEDSSVRHMGPTAQDFYAAFGLGQDDRHIAALDSSGVALAAIQGLYQQVQQLQADNAALKAENAALETRLAAVEAAIASSGKAPRPLQAGLVPGAGSCWSAWCWDSSSGAKADRKLKLPTDSYSLIRSSVSEWASLSAAGRTSTGKRPCRGLIRAPNAVAAQNSQASGRMKALRLTARCSSASCSSSQPPNRP